MSNARAVADAKAAPHVPNKPMAAGLAVSSVTPISKSQIIQSISPIGQNMNLWASKVIHRHWPGGGKRKAFSHGTAAVIGLSVAAMSEERLANLSFLIDSSAKLAMKGTVTAMAAGPKAACAAETLIDYRVVVSLALRAHNSY
jgi:hypothetical protein